MQNNKCGHLGLAIVAVLLLWNNATAMIITIYNSNRIFVASDSYMHVKHKNYEVQKSFKMNDSCVVSIYRAYGVGRLSSSEEGVSLELLPDLLKSFCDSATPPGTISNVLHNAYLNLPGRKLKTWLVFNGYDHTNGMFFNMRCCFNGTNPMTCIRYKYGEPWEREWLPIGVYTRGSRKLTHT